MKTLQLSYILFLIPILIPSILTYKFNLDESQIQYNIFFASFTGSQSHVKGILNLGYELQQAGHKFSLLTTPKRMKWGNKYNITSYSVGKDESTALFSRVKKYEENSGKFNTDDFFAKDIDELVIKPYEYAFMELKEIVDKENPDLIICDFISVVCMDIASILKVPMIITFQSIDFGNVIINDYISLISEYDKLSIEEMNIFDRFYHFFWVKVMKYYYYFPVISKLKAMKNKFNVPFSIATIKGNFQQGLIWANTFWGYEIPRYLPPNIQLIGPIKDALEDTKQVEEVDTFLIDKQKVIYISFGTNLILSDIEFNLIYQQLNQLIKNKLIDGVIWSLTNTKLSNKVNKKEDNKSILFINYLNQQLLLHNNKIIIFITHSGLESIFESIQSNTPMLNLPFYFDQPRNSFKNDRIQISETILKYQLLKDNNILYNKLKVMLNNLNYYKNYLNLLNHLIKINQKDNQLLIQDLINYIILAKKCRKLENNNNNKLHPYFIPPCEIVPFQSISDHINPIILHHLDIKLLLFLSFFTLIYLLRKLIIYIKLILFNPQSNITIDKNKQE